MQQRNSKTNVEALGFKNFIIWLGGVCLFVCFCFVCLFLFCLFDVPPLGMQSYLDVTEVGVTW